MKSEVGLTLERSVLDTFSTLTKSHYAFSTHTLFTILSIILRSVEEDDDTDDAR